MFEESQRGHLSGFEFSDDGLGLVVVVVVVEEDCRTPVGGGNEASLLPTLRPSAAV